jgi:hypothetical protein
MATSHQQRESVQGMAPDLLEGEGGVSVPDARPAQHPIDVLLC